MNRNEKTIQMFLAERQKKRDRAAEVRGVNPESCTFKSVPASKRVKK